ncbi:hypothetical protein SO802_007926 [Lithocarpus litseifolius]|uniref:Uncharacterized protein n=1 Tax=Lithocarpus litseifolius TaxID=425828 RepID=A0AAW2DTD9_9ROSI
MAQMKELCTNPVSVACTDQIKNIVMLLQRSEGLSKHMDFFMQMLSLVQFNDVTPFVLTPLLSDELREADFMRNMNLFNDCGEDDFDSILAEMEKEMSMGDIMKELGYGCTVNASQCKEILSLFLPLPEFTLSKILGTIACTQAGLEDNQNTFSTFSLAVGCSNLSDLPLLNSWNIDAPATNWIRVIENMDHEGFYIPNHEAFSFFMSVYRRACQSKNNSSSSISTNSITDPDFAKHLLSFSEFESVVARYQDGYSKLRSWTYSSLDLYKHELLRVLYPVFMQMFHGSGGERAYSRSFACCLLRQGMEQIVINSETPIIKEVEKARDNSAVAVAVMSSDIAIAQFRNLQRLLLVDGHWCYRRISTMECLKFLMEIQFGGSQDFSTNLFHDSGAVSNRYLETSSTFMKVLKAHTGLITSSQLAEEMEKLHAPVMDPNPRLPNGKLQMTLEMTSLHPLLKSYLGQ